MTTMIDEDPPVATTGDPPTATIVGDATTIATFGAEDPGADRHRTTTTITTTATGLRTAAGIPMDRTGAGEVHPLPTAVDATTGTNHAATRGFPESRCWCETLVPTSRTRTLGTPLGASVRSGTCTFRGTTTRSRPRALPLSSMRIPSRLARPATRWTASASRDANWKWSLPRNAASLPTRCGDGWSTNRTTAEGVATTGTDPRPSNATNAAAGTTAITITTTTRTAAATTERAMPEAMAATGNHPPMTRDRLPIGAARTKTSKQAAETNDPRGLCGPGTVRNQPRISTATADWWIVVLW
mmetsp:Transcript_25352/g.69864  ORF Transcript_25352/g.69864 Transcript_25352/m.69864 type:complete len:300 (+) Transcript_25352:671-1570(+)